MSNQSGINTRQVQLSALLLARGLEVLAVEPSAGMAEAAARRLGGSPLFRPISASAERTGLPACSVDAISCAQSFHWFRAEEAVEEFRRILRPAGSIFLLWNELSKTHDMFHAAYARTLEACCPDLRSYRIGELSYSTDYFKRLFGSASVSYRRLANHQFVNRDQIVGRTTSLSFSPPPDSAQFRELVRSLDKIHGDFHTDGVVRLQYDVEIYQIKP